MTLLGKVYYISSIIILLLLYYFIFFNPQKAHATEYGEPDNSAYFNTLTLPDDSAVSCCGEGDVYYADKVDNCDPNREYEKFGCALVAIITDTRPNDIILKDGRKITRLPIPVGTRIAVPKNKIRKKPIPNPTEHNIIFVKPYETGGFTVHCWESVSGQ